MVQFLLNIGFEWLYKPEPGYITEYVFVSGDITASATGVMEDQGEWLVYIDDPIAGVTDTEIVTTDPAEVIRFIQENWKP